MVEKQVLCTQRVRRIPEHFSWVDHRLIRDDHINRCSVPALAMYLFLVTVADAQGLSYYSDRSIAQRLHLEAQDLDSARRQLCELGLIAYRKPLYQVLELGGVA